jgi:hypothetical protein
LSGRPRRRPKWREVSEQMGRPPHAVAQAGAAAADADSRLCRR